MTDNVSPANAEKTSHCDANASNRLSLEDSPYLKQHAANPVDWYPWGREAFARAREEEKPIFLSIGYSACHWCHVMETESFECSETARILNTHYVCVKVDREERPEVDRIYMEAVQLMTGRGGWPLTVFLTPDLRPFFGGSYFPPESRFGLPGFKHILTEIGRLWQEERQKLTRNAAQIVRHLTDSDHAHEPDSNAVDWDLVRQGLKYLDNAFDSTWGGFGKAPKFPSVGALQLLLKDICRTQQPARRQMLETTLDKMARGGIFDHLAGGFHRYTVDAEWKIPHFEKMLYDNALLADVYTQAFQLTGNPRYREIAARTLDFVLGNMTAPNGMFYSSVDADSDGTEGAYYSWTADETRQTLGSKQAELIEARFGITPRGNIDGRNVLYIAATEDELAAQFLIDPETIRKQLQSAQAALLAERAKRPAPQTDRKQLTSWNGLAIAALSRAYAAFGTVEYAAAAEKAARQLIATMFHENRLMHSCIDQRAKHDANADDYAYLAQGLLALYSVTGTAQYLDVASKLSDVMVENFWDMEQAGFFYTPADREHLISREKCFTDESTPSANAVAADVLTTLGRLTGKETYVCMARQALMAAAPMARIYPGAFMATFGAVHTCLSAPVDVTVIGERGTAETDALLRVLGENLVPNLVPVTWYPNDSDAQRHAELVPSLNQRKAIPGKAVAYVCENRTCSPPVTEPDVLSDILKSLMDKE